MAKKKELLAAGCIKDILFSSDEEREIYIHTLERVKIRYKILEKLKREDGTVIIRILQQYNTAPLIKLFNED